MFVRHRGTRKFIRSHGVTGRADRTGVRLLRGLVAGAVAGAVASFAMDRFQVLASPLLPSSGGDREPATELAADAVAQIVGGRDLPEEDKPLAGQAVHYLMAVGLGIAYGIAAEFKPGVTVGYGAGFGIGVATFLDEGIVPAVGLGSAPWKADLATNAYSYISHLVFGSASEFVRRQVAATLTK